MPTSPKKKKEPKSDKIKIRIDGNETLRHQKELEISKEDYEHLKSLFKSEKKY